MHAVPGASYSGCRAGYLLGIDWGTSVLKAGVFDARTGTIVASASRNLPSRNGFEQDVDAGWRLFARVVEELRAQCGSRWQHVCGIGLATQGGSSILAARATGRACTPMVLWNDTRGAEDCAELTRRTTPRFWHAHFRLGAPPAGLGRLAWLKRTRPDLFTSKHIHVGAGEWVFHRLTAVWRQDAGNALQIGTYSPVKRGLVDTALRLIALPLDVVAPLRQGHETAPLAGEAARLLGLPSGIPVAGPYIDQEAGYLAAAGACARPLHCSLGTAWVGNFRLPKDVRGSSPFQLVLPSPLDDGDLIVHPLLTGNASWDWAVSTFLDGARADASTRVARMLAKRIVPPEGLLALPYTLQPNPLAGATGAAMIFGVSTATTRDDLIRAVVAGMACELGRVFAALREHNVIDGVVLGGGASQGKCFRDWIAALFHPLPVLYQREPALSAARGAVHVFAPHAALAPVKQALPSHVLPPRDAALWQAYYRTLHGMHQKQFPLSMAFAVEDDRDRL